jgi:hypothetical protein
VDPTPQRLKQEKEGRGVWLLGRRGDWARNGVLEGRPSRSSGLREKGFRLKNVSLSLNLNLFQIQTTHNKIQKKTRKDQITNLP